MSYPTRKGGPRRPDAQFRATPPREQKRSLAVPLMALGGAAIFGMSLFGRTHPVQRNRYDSLEDCARDYSTGQCELDNPVGSNNTSGGYHGGLHYYGPWYRSDGGGGARDPGPGRTMGSLSRSMPASGFAGGPRGVELGERGGFGSSGRVFARGS